MHPETVGILSTGEMGTSIARAIRDHGLRPVTYLQGRSRETRANAVAGGVEAVDTAGELVRQSDLLLSVVPPAAAIDVARTVATGAGTSGEDTLLVDLNAIGPATVQAIADEVPAAVDVVDGCIIGPAHPLADATVYVSGPRAAELAELNHYGLHVEALGDRIGQVSGLKLCYAGLTKGTLVVATDLLLGALALGIEEPLLALYRDRLSDLPGHLESRLPGHPKRAGRRAEEMQELAAMLESLAVSGEVFRASHDRLAWLETLGLDTDDAGSATETARRVHEAARERDAAP